MTWKWEYRCHWGDEYRWYLRFRHLTMQVWALADKWVVEGEITHPLTTKFTASAGRSEVRSLEEAKVQAEELARLLAAWVGMELPAGHPEKEEAE